MGTHITCCGQKVVKTEYNFSYIQFNKFKQAICYALEGSFYPHNMRHPSIPKNKKLNPHRWYWNSNKFSKQKLPGLYAFLSCDDTHSSLNIKNMRLLIKNLTYLYEQLAELDIFFNTIPGPFPVSTEY